MSSLRWAGVHWDLARCNACICRRVRVGSWPDAIKGGSDGEELVATIVGLSDGAPIGLAVRWLGEIGCFRAE